MRRSFSVGGFCIILALILGRSSAALRYADLTITGLENHFNVEKGSAENQAVSLAINLSRQVSHQIETCVRDGYAVVDLLHRETGISPEELLASAKTGSGISIKAGTCGQELHESSAAAKAGVLPCEKVDKPTAKPALQRYLGQV